MSLPALPAPQATLRPYAEIGQVCRRIEVYHDAGVPEMVNDWITYMGPRIAESTDQSYYYSAVRVFAKNFCGSTLTDTAGPGVLQTHVNRYAETRSKKTVQRYVRLLRQIFCFAVARGYLSDNPMRDVITPKMTPGPDPHIFDIDELRILLDYLKDDKYMYAAVYLASMTGMRRGEVYGLRWENVDLRNGFISVRRELQYIRRKIKIKPPKTKSSIRRIDLDAETVAFLHCMQNGQKYVFADSTGEIQYPRDFNMARLCRAAKIAPGSFRDLRRTHATWLASRGAPITSIQERLGHVNPYTTFIYVGCVMPTVQREAVEIMDAVNSEMHAPSRADINASRQIVQLDHVAHQCHS